MKTKFKVGDIIRSEHLECSVYRVVVGILPGSYSVSYRSNNTSSAVLYEVVNTLSFEFVDELYVLDTEHKRRTEFNIDIKDILSEV